ncbi:ABC transporter substrate-binding protein [Paenibacillus sp. MY03]|jgi:putative aldouronate transport system substrate-binding protein|uniref:extracellular solute-binding protein n=1 Tax=Paenibacillus sp. MY03 TaxID=302980 RepID=UPI000B3CD92A|nr:extracellular solute-binding protein [Paenibacillus sp. MY03]OUS76640.1 ABC transporter substrate-binding protein [Paenibacillus sp. MY03]
MNAKSKKWSAGLMAVAVSTSILAGCSGNDTGGNEPSSKPTTNPTSNPATEAPKSDPITLRIELFDRNNTPAGAPPITDNFMTNYIQENFGDPNNIKVEFVTVPRTQEVEKLNVLMAANQAPDLVYTYDTPTVQKYVKDGGLTDLGPYLEQFGQNLKTVLGETVLNYGKFEGVQYAIPARRVLLPESTTIMRQDWLDEVGLPIPTTTDEFYNTLKAFKEKKPGKSGDKVIPYSNIDPFHSKPLQYSFWEWDKISDADLYATPDWLLPGNKEAFRFMNKLYNEGLIDPDFPLTMNKDFQKFQKDLINGVVGSGTANTNEPVYQGYLAEVSKADANAKVVPINPFTTPDGKTPKALYSPNGMYIFVPKTSKNAEAVVKYLDWMAMPENFIPLQNGTEGKTYEMVDGVPQVLDNEEAKQTLYNYTDYAIILNGKLASSTDEKLNLAVNASDPNYKDFTVASFEMGTKDGVIKPSVTTPIQAEIKYATTLKEKTDEIFVKVITAKPADFDKVYDNEVNDYMKIGGQEVMDEKRQAFEATK